MLLISVMLLTAAISNSSNITYNSSYSQQHAMLIIAVTYLQYFTATIMLIAAISCSIQLQLLTAAVLPDSMSQQFTYSCNTCAVLIS